MMGRVYAASTVGSLVGTFLTGFVLIAYVGTRAIVLAAGLDRWSRSGSSPAR
jgi:hypothetical protein